MANAGPAVILTTQVGSPLSTTYGIGFDNTTGQMGFVETGESGTHTIRDDRGIEQSTGQLTQSDAGETKLEYP
jgi:hypothetical protein